MRSVLEDVQQRALNGALWFVLCSSAAPCSAFELDQGVFSLLEGSKDIMICPHYCRFANINTYRLFHTLIDDEEIFDLCKTVMALLPNSPCKTCWRKLR